MVLKNMINWIKFTISLPYVSKYIFFETIFPNGLPRESIHRAFSCKRNGAELGSLLNSVDLQYFQILKRVFSFSSKTQWGELSCSHDFPSKSAFSSILKLSMVMESIPK